MGRLFHFILSVKERVQMQREDGKGLELNIVAESSDGRVVLVEVKKTQAKMDLNRVEDFYEKVQIYN